MALDYNGPDAPEHIQKVLRTYGLNPFGELIYRLVMADKVLEKIGGIWNDWLDTIDAADRGKIITGEDGRPTSNGYTAQRTIAEVREVERYPHLEGWVLERWFPVEYLGTPEQVWSATKVPGYDVPLFGPYPTQGMYMLVGGPCPVIPEGTYVEDVIAFWEERRESQVSDCEQAVRLHMNRITEDFERRQAKTIRENTERFAHQLSTFNSPTLEAGRWRTKLAEQAGATSHIGN